MHSPLHLHVLAPPAILFADLDAADFAADGLGQGVDELHDAGVFVGRRDALDVILNLVDELVAGAVAILAGEDDGGLHHLPANLVRDARDGALHNRRVRHQRALHLEGADAITGALDHVVGAAHVPEVAVLVAPSDVARVIDAVVPGLTRALRVAVILLKESDRATLVCADHDLPLLTVLGRCAVGAQQIDVVLRVGQAHRPGLGRGPGEGADGERRLRLAVALHEADAGEAEEGVVDRRVQRLASDGAILERGEVVAREVFADQEAEDGGRGAERGDTVIVDHAQDVCGHELLVVVDEDRSAGDPLSIELAPDGFPPARVGDGEVEAVRMQVVPEGGRGDVAERVEEIVDHHLRFTRRAGGEVHERCVVVRVHACGANKGRGVLDALLEVVEPGRHLRAYADQRLERGGVGQCIRDVAEDLRFTGADDGLNVGRIGAIDDVFLRQQVSGRDSHRAELMQRNDGEPELVASLEDEHHFVAAANAERLEIGGGTIRSLLDLCKSEVDVLALIVRPAEGASRRLLFGPSIDDVVSVVKVLGYADMEIVFEIFLRRERGLRQKTFYHLL